jgi:rubrerythrin
MTLNESQFGGVQCIDCGESLSKGTTHIHLSENEVNMYKAMAHAADEHHKVDKAARYKPFNLNDTEALRAHLKSSGHYMHTESVDNTEHEYLLSAHEDDHADGDQYPPEEREHHTNIGGRHKHVEM